MSITHYSSKNKPQQVHSIHDGNQIALDAAFDAPATDWRMAAIVTAERLIRIIQSESIFDEHCANVLQDRIEAWKSYEVCPSVSTAERPA